MIPEQQVPPLEVCKHLKELGWNTPTLFKWVKGVNGWQLIYGSNYPSDMENLPAPIVAELGEELPIYVYTIKDSNGFYCWGSYENYPDFLEEDIEPIHANTEADARARMWIYIQQNTLI